MCGYLWTVVLLTCVCSVGTQCTCSCSSITPSQDTCTKPADGHINPGAHTNRTCDCPDQGELLDLLQSLQTTVTSLESKLSTLTHSVRDLKESLPDTVQKGLNVSWTVSPGRNNPDTPYPGDIVWEGLHKTHPRDCQEILDAGDSHGDGVYRIYNEGRDEFNNVRCNMDCDGGGWLIFMHRLDGSVDFNRTWNDYVNGFGHLTSEFWMGLDFLYNLTNLHRSVVLRVDLVTEEDDHKYSQYVNFHLGDKTSHYQLTAGSYTGSAGSGFSGGNGRAFSTYDSDNDAVSRTNCASAVGGGWWFYPSSSCGFTWPTGRIDEELVSAKLGGIAYGSSINNYVVYKEVTIKIRPAFQQP